MISLGLPASLLDLPLTSEAESLHFDALLIPSAANQNNKGDHGLVSLSGLQRGCCFQLMKRSSSQGASGVKMLHALGLLEDHLNSM